MRMLTSLFVFLLATSASAQSADQAAALRTMLLQGVTTIGKPGVPGPVAALSEKAVVVAGHRMKGGLVLPLIVAAEPGLGRLVLFGHGGYLSSGELAREDGTRLVTNAFAFVAGERRKARVGLVGHDQLAPLLEQEGLAVARLEVTTWRKKLGQIDVLVIGQSQVPDLEAAEALVDFVEKGGGLIASGLIWGWQQLNPELSPTRDLRINRVLRDLGVMLCGGTIGEIIQPAQAGADELDAASGAHALAHFEEVLSAKKLTARDGAQAGLVLSTILRWWPEGDDSFPKRIDRITARSNADLVPTAKRPLTTKDPLARLALTADHLRSLRVDPAETAAAPSAADFPGQPDAATKAVAKTLRIDPKIPGWHSTGLYARAGQALTVRIPKTVAGGRLRLRIGAHTDLLWDKDSWRRHPELSRSWPLRAAESRLAGPHGGLVYIEVPDRLRGEPFEATITGAVEAPLFVLGETDPADWRDRIRKLDAPWAELACDRVVLTVRSEAIRAIEDPTELMTFWSGVLDLYPQLGSRPAGPRPQRFVADRQISAGYLHSGYPIMMQLHHSEEITALDRLRDAPPEESHGWGFWHELGHNHQRPDWTFGGTTEVTCNLFSLFVDHQIRGVEPAKHRWPASSRMKVAPHVKGERRFEVWKKDPGLALWTYILIQEEFGWEPFMKVFAVYEKLPREERPRNDQEKRDQFMWRLSLVLGRDLGPYFEAWGIPISAEARARTAELEPWMPRRIAAFRDLQGDGVK